MLDLDAAAQSPTKGPKVLQANDALDIRFSIKNLQFQFIIRFHGMVISNRIGFLYFVSQHKRVLASLIAANHLKANKFGTLQHCVACARRVASCNLKNLSTAF
jgi:hypothetical protein